MIEPLNLLFIAGTTASDERGVIVAPMISWSDPVIFQIRRDPAEAGAGLSIVETTRFATDNLRKTADAARVFLRRHPAAIEV
jgi:hypothetical protein